MDKEEIKKRIHHIFNWKSHIDPNDIIKCLLMNDVVKLDEYRKEISNIEEKIKFYCDEIDNARTDDELRKIGSSIKR